MRIAVQQIDIVWEDVPQNLEQIERCAAQASAIGCELCLFPEMAACGFSMRSLEMARACAGVPDRLKRLAQDLNLWVGTSYPEQSDPNTLPYNAFVLAGPQGQWVCYRKIHPFSLANEQAHYGAGDHPVTVTIAGLRCSLAVCYDLRFANAFWSSAPHTDAYLVIANWPRTRARAWRTLLAARAIENQAYVVGCNRVGCGSGLLYNGDSCVLDPLGRPIVRASMDPTMLTAHLDPHVVAEIRSELPFLPDRRELPWTPEASA